MDPEETTEAQESQDRAYLNDSLHETLDPARYGAVQSENVPGDNIPFTSTMHAEEFADAGARRQDERPLDIGVQSGGSLTVTNAPMTTATLRGGTTQEVCSICGKDLLSHIPVYVESPNDILVPILLCAECNYDMYSLLVKTLKERNEALKPEEYKD